jgi:hypothetical protein
MAGLAENDTVTLTKALASSFVIPGDTLSLAPGTYSANYLNTLLGTGAAPITIKPKTPGTVTIDGSLSLINGGNIILDGLIFTDTSWVNRDVYSEEGRATGAIYVAGAPNIKVRNCIIHNGVDGIAAFGNSLVELYGCLIYNNGAGGQGHCMYTHNNSGTYTLIENNIFMPSYNYGWHAHSSGTNFVKNYHLKKNIFGQCNFKHTFGNDTGKELAVQDILFEENETIHSYWWFNRWSNSAKNITVRNNYFVGYGTTGGDDGCCSFKIFDTVDCHDNTFVHHDGLLVRVKWAAGTPSYTFANNTYYGTDVNSFMGKDDALMNFAAWCAEIGETGSTFNAYPPADRVVVIPNTYDASRCHVAVYNYSLADTVTVDVSGVYSSDEVVKVHQAQDYFNDIQTLTVSQAGTIAIDMRAEVHTVELPYASTEAIDPLMCPLYGAFVVTL